MIINHIPNSTGIFESVTSQNEMKQISQETTLSLLTCPKEILDLKHDVCLNEPRFNDISFNDLQSNEFCFRIMSALSKVELFCMVPKAQSQSLEYDMLVPSLGNVVLYLNERGVSAKFNELYRNNHKTHLFFTPHQVHFLDS
jgi:hypothetical protein